MLMQCAPFMPENTHFLTFKGPDKKHQKIGYVSDLCRKIASTYVIARERNNLNDGYHFHAVLAIKKTPPTSWYKKGVHMHLQKIGGVNGVLPPDWQPPLPGLTQREIEDMTHFEGKDVTEAYLVEVLIAKGMKKQRKLTHLDKVLRYCSKELDMPMQYTDYIFVVNGKQRKIKGG